MDRTGDRTHPEEARLLPATSWDGGPAGGERRFRALVERGSDLALVCDRDLVIRYAGPTLREIFGYRLEDVVGTSGWSFVHAADQPRLADLWQRVLAAPGSHERIEVRIAVRGGGWRWVEERVTNLLDDPAVEGVVIDARDVTAYREAAEALAAREELHRSVLEASQEGVWVTDVSGRTLFANAKMAEILRVDRDELAPAAPRTSSATTPAPPCANR